MTVRNTSDFYENVFGISQKIIDRVMPFYMRVIVREVHNAHRISIEEQENNVQNRSDYREIDVNNLSDIVEHFNYRPELRDSYLRRFPRYKQTTEGLVLALNAAIEKLEKLEGVKKRKLWVSACLGIPASIVKYGSYFFYPLSPAVSIAASGASILNSVFQASTSIVEHSSTEKHMLICLELIQQYESEVKSLYRLFAYNERLINSIKKAIGSRTAELIFEIFKEIHKNVDQVSSGYPATETLKSLSEVLTRENYSPAVASHIAAALCHIFWLNWGCTWISDFSKGALALERMKTCLEIGAYSSNVFLSFQSLETSWICWEANPLTKGTLIGTAIDLYPLFEHFVLQNSETRSSRRVKVIKDNVDKIQHNLEIFEDAYNQLNAEKDAKPPIQ